MVDYRILKLLPKNIESYIAGKVSQLRKPTSFVRACNKVLVKRFNIDLSDAEKSLEEYQSFEELFSRALKPGARPIKGALCAPCDSILRQSLPVERGQIIQAKGLRYSVEDLLGLSGQNTSDFKPAWYCSFYLAPHNYHRVHAPFSGQMPSARYIPGELWPVNEHFVKVVPRLFCRNERVVFELLHPQGGKAFLVMVGALNVGRIKIKGVDSFVSNNLERQFKRTKDRLFSFSPNREVTVGDELGTFMLGSSVILVFDENFTRNFKFKKITKPSSTRVGDVLLGI